MNRQPDYKKAKNAALDLLEKYKITKPPVNPVDLARKMGVEVYFVRFKDAGIK